MAVGTTATLLLAPLCAHPAARPQQAGPVRAARQQGGLGSYPDLAVALPRRASLAAAPPPAAPDGAQIGSAGSLNWSGYAMNRHKVAFSSVSATFFVPFLNCVKSPGVTLSSAWAGLDGFVGRPDSVEQVGIAANCSATGKASYSAWFEMFPRPETSIPASIHAGDSVTVQVAFRPSDQVFSLKLTDNTRGEHFARYRRCPDVRAGGRRVRCPRNSAEVIAEAPATSTGKRVIIAHLSDYGAISFAGVSIIDGAGKGGGIVSAHWNATKIIQVRSSAGPVIARPTPVQLAMFDSYWLRED